MSRSTRRAWRQTGTGRPGIFQGSRGSFRTTFWRRSIQTKWFCCENRACWPVVVDDSINNFIILLLLLIIIIIIIIMCFWCFGSILLEMHKWSVTILLYPNIILWHALIIDTPIFHTSHLTSTITAFWRNHLRWRLTWGCWVWYWWWWGYCTSCRDSSGILSISPLPMLKAGYCWCCCWKAMASGSCVVAATASPNDGMYTLEEPAE